MRCSTLYNIAVYKGFSREVSHFLPDHGLRMNANREV